jgi:hypothetical protein
LASLPVARRAMLKLDELVVTDREAFALDADLSPESKLEP